MSADQKLVLEIEPLLGIPKIIFKRKKEAAGGGNIALNSKDFSGQTLLISNHHKSPKYDLIISLHSHPLYTLVCLHKYFLRKLIEDSFREVGEGCKYFSVTRKVEEMFGFSLFAN